MKFHVITKALVIFLIFAFAGALYAADQAQTESKPVAKDAKTSQCCSQENKACATDSSKTGCDPAKCTAADKDKCGHAAKAACPQADKASCPKSAEKKDDNKKGCAAACTATCPASSTCHPK